MDWFSKAAGQAIAHVQHQDVVNDLMVGGYMLSLEVHLETSLILSQNL